MTGTVGLGRHDRQLHSQDLRLDPILAVVAHWALPSTAVPMTDHVTSSASCTHRSSPRMGLIRLELEGLRLSWPVPLQRYHATGFGFFFVPANSASASRILRGADRP